MFFSLPRGLLFCTLFLNIFGSALAVPVLETRQSGSVSQSVYDELERFAKYSSAAYQLICPRPLGTNLVKTMDKAGTQGFISRDDSKKEIVVSFRGSMEIKDAWTNIQLLFTPLSSPGITDVGGAQVHTGFLKAYNVVADEVISSVRSQLASRPSYTVVVTGHSLGGAVGSLAALSLKYALPNLKLKLYTYGQPRVGNAAFASLVESRVGVNNIFRATHTYDGVPTILLKPLGYRHFGTEYWQYADPGKPSSVKKCTLSDDPSCSDSIPSTFINPAHVVYFNQPMALNPLLCLF